MIFDKKALEMALADGRIIVDPLERELIGHNSIDFRLGEDLWEYAGYDTGQDLIAGLYGEPPGSTDYGPFAFAQFKKVTPITHGATSTFMERSYVQEHILGYSDISPYPIGDTIVRYMAKHHKEGTQYFVLNPYSFYLATSLECFGTTAGSGIVPSVRAKSTTGRNFLTVALCAGLGDEGYAGRWALEVHTAHSYVPIAVGTVIGQAVFEHTVSGPGTTNDYKKDTGYQKPDGSVSFIPKAMKVIPR